MMKRIAEASPGVKARIAGVFYLLVFLTGGFALVVRSRVGDAAGLVAGVLYIAVTLLLYDLFKPVNKSLSLLAAVINHPELLDEVGEDLGSAEFLAFDLDRLRQAVVEAAGIPGLDTDRLKSHLRDQGFSGELRSVLRAEVYQHSAFARPEAALDAVRQGWKEAFGKHQLPILHAQVREAEQAVAREMTPENQRRFYDLKKRLYELELKAREWIG